MQKCIMTFLFSLLLVSCSKKCVKQDITEMMFKSIKFPTNTAIIINGQDSLACNYYKSDYKLVVHTDSTSCSSCALNKLYMWEDLVEWSEQYNGAFKFYFIFSPPKDENIRFALRNSMLDYPMLLDSLGEFERLNPHLPRNKAMHTFLLDEDNNVVLVGNPLNNPEIEKMLKTIVEERLNNQ